MPIVTTDSLRNSLRHREISPVYVLFGAETYLRDLAVKTISDKSFEAGELRDFNESDFTLNTEGNLAVALAAAEQLPMMARRRVIRINDVRVGSSAVKDTLREDEENALAAYLAKPAEFSVVIFVADDLDKRRRMTKVLTDRATAVEFGELNDHELAKWARGKVSDAGSQIDDAALRLLVSLTGPDVRRLTTEIEKLSTAALPGKVISAALVDTLVANAREASNFDLTDHLFAGHKHAALKALKKILDDGGEPLALLGLISYNLRRLLIAKEAMAQGIDLGEVARVAKVRYSDRESFLASARRADERMLSRAIQLLSKTDIAIKTSLGGPGQPGARLQIEMLVAELASL